MSDRDLIRRVRELGDALQRASVWQGPRIEVDGARDDFVYELLCYLTVALAAVGPFIAELILRYPRKTTGKLLPLFPKKPGYKKNFSYLVLKTPDGKVAFELCPGVWITDRHGKDRAPDINLLLPNGGDNPGYTDLRVVWDAKYVQDEAKLLADTAVSDFVFTFEELGSPEAPADWGNAIAVPAFRGSGLLTNGRPSTEPLETLRKRRVFETSRFPKNPATRP
jgi:hypothetical protein